MIRSRLSTTHFGFTRSKAGARGRPTRHRRISPLAIRWIGFCRKRKPISVRLLAPPERKSPRSAARTQRPTPIRINPLSRLSAPRPDRRSHERMAETRPRRAPLVARMPGLCRSNWRRTTRHGPGSMLNFQPGPLALHRCPRSRPLCPHGGLSPRMQALPIPGCDRWRAFPPLPVRGPTPQAPAPPAQASVASIASAAGIPPQIAANIAAAVRVAPDAPLNELQEQRAKTIIQNYAARRAQQQVSQAASGGQGQPPPGGPIIPRCGSRRAPRTRRTPF